jgi:hypothetical protein
LQEGLIKTIANGATPVEPVQTMTSSDAGIQKEPVLKGSVDRLKPTLVKDGSKDTEEGQVSTTNGALRDDPVVGKEKSANYIEDEAGDKNRDKDRERQKPREFRDGGRDWDAEREPERSRARGRDRDRERRDKEREREERENAKERDYRRKERSRDLGEFCTLIDSIPECS